MIRIKAASTHFILSVVIFVSVIVFSRYFWYPPPHFSASGGWQGLKIVASVDLVLGPLLTLIVFDLSKGVKKLLFDLTLIAMIQFSALAWGVTTIFQQRPVAVVFWEDGFYAVPAIALKDQQIPAFMQTQQVTHKPVFVYAEKPQTVEGLKQLIESLSQQSLAPHHQAALYRPLQPFFDDIKPMQVNIDEIVATNSEMKKALDTILHNNNTKISDYCYFSLKSKYRNIILIFSPVGELIDYIEVPSRSN